MIKNDLKFIMAACAIVTLFAAVICFFISKVCAIICLLTGILLTALFVVVINRRQRDMIELNTYLSLVCAGNYDLDIEANAEGELSILKNNLLKVITLLRTQNEMLERDKTYLTDSLADISHQLKTPLTSMMVMTELLSEEKEEGKRREFLSVIDNQLDRMKWLITNLLKLSKLDAGTVDMKKEPIASSQLIAESLNPFSIPLEIKGITLENNVTDFELMVDRGWTSEALQNIIKNCIEHTGEGGNITISSSSTNIYNEIVISDNGCGIGKEDLPHIFERFYHGKESSGESVGIGLALAKAIFEKENASISVNSQEGVGTQFAIKFYNAIV